MSDMRTSGRHKAELNQNNLEPHREENPDDWRKNLGFWKSVQLINKGYGFSGRLKRG